MANDFKNTQEAIDKFRKYVITQSKANLTRDKKNYTKNLYNSIKGEVVSEKDFFILGFSMDEYGSYVDKGVKGADPSQVSKNAKIKGQQAPNSPFSFKTKRPPSEPLAQWAKKKNIRLRDEKGKFKEGNYKTIGIIIAKNIWARGLKPSLFFTKPFDVGYERFLNTDLVRSFGDDIDIIIDRNIKI